MCVIYYYISRLLFHSNQENANVVAEDEGGMIGAVASLLGGLFG